MSTQPQPSAPHTIHIYPNPNNNETTLSVLLADIKVVFVQGNAVIVTFHDAGRPDLHLVCNSTEDAGEEYTRITDMRERYLRSVGQAPKAPATIQIEEDGCIRHLDLHDVSEIQDTPYDESGEAGFLKLIREDGNDKTGINYQNPRERDVIINAWQAYKNSR